MRVINLISNTYYEAAAFGQPPDDETLDRLPVGVADDVREVAVRIAAFHHAGDRGAATQERAEAVKAIPEILGRHRIGITADAADLPGDLIDQWRNPPAADELDPRRLAATIPRP